MIEVGSKRSLRLAAIGLVILLLQAACGGDEPAGGGTPTAGGTPELVPLRVAAILGAGQGVFSTVMKEQGIDRRFGFELEIIPISQTGQQWLSVRDGSADVASGSILDLLRNRGSGLDVKAFAAFLTWIQPIVTLADSPIQTFEDLRGTRFGTPSNTLLDFMVIRAAGKKALGIDLGTDAEVIEAAPNLLNELLMRREFDAMVQFSSLTEAPLAEGTFRLVSNVPRLMGAAGFNPDSFYLTFNVSDEWAAAHPDRLDELASAFDTTMQTLLENDDAWEPVLEEIGIEDPESARAFIAGQRAIMGAPYNRSLLEPTRELVEALIEIVGVDDVGISEFDPDAFLFPKE